MNIIATLVFVLIFNLTIYSQTNHLNNIDSMEIILSEKVEGFGPKGNTSRSISPKNLLDSLELAACPKMKNIPDNLSNVVEYCFHLNRFQFFYQNYRNGIFTKDYFLNEATKQKWNLNDTILLTEKYIKTTISIATGINSEGIGMYIIDSQNNDDFSDDALKVLLTSTPYSQEEVVSSSCHVEIDCFNGKSIKREKQLMFVKLSRGYINGKLSISFSFPQFRYSKFNYKNKSYLVCAESLNDNQAIYVLNDKPYFTAPGDGKEVLPFQFVLLDGDYFQYFSNSQNAERIILKKVSKESEDIGNHNVKNITFTINGNLLPVANQVGMSAPEISGLEILKDLNISLSSFKGKYVFIDFWSTTCGPCIAEFPKIKEVYDKYNRNELQIIGVVDDRTKGKIKEFIKGKDINWPNINMNIKSTNVKGYNIKTYPTSYLINPNGVIIATNLRGDELLNKLQSIKKNNLK